MQIIFFFFLLGDIFQHREAFEPEQIENESFKVYKSILKVI